MTKDFKCSTCGEKLVTNGYSMTTLVGYFSPPGHNHDDNCETVLYFCPQEHEHVTLSVRNKCPKCDWKGKKQCFCHEGDKLDEWPD